ncbi:restriction endonuclease subunit S [Streptomyces sp. NPDC056230]|uniref:restriction endonuclease subunit S n=1 Tax=Streptomyces sp. NPDC056230 TaxID=3345754 RepID=UPI0035D977BF
MTTDSGAGPEPGGPGSEGDVTGELPPGWVRTTLGEVVSPISDRRKPGTRGDLPYLGMDNVESHTGKVLKLGTAASIKSASPIVKPGYVLYGRLRPYLNKVVLADFDGICSGEFIVFPPSEAIEPRFLLHRLLSPDFVQYVMRKNPTGDRPRAYWEQFVDFPILLPPLSEQRRIVAKLGDQLEHLAAGEAAVQAALAASATLAGQITGTGACGGLDGAELFPAPLEPADADDGTLPDLPNGWRWARLGEIADVVGGVTKDSKKQSDPEYVEVPYLRVANVQRGRIVLDRVEKIRVSPKKAELLKLEVGDVLLNEGGDRDKLGRGWIWEGQIENCIHQNHVFRARVTGDVLDPRLLAWHANAFGKNWCDRNGKQTVNLASISLRRIKLMPVPVPPKSVQVDLVKSVESRLTEAEAAQQVIQGVYEQGADLRRALLRAAFTGALVAQDPDDEPASVLLDRIRAQRAVGAKPARRKRVPRPRTTPPAAPQTSGRLVPSGTQEALPL